MFRLFVATDGGFIAKQNQSVGLQMGKWDIFTIY
jgi:hypothetical protein